MKLISAMSRTALLLVAFTIANNGHADEAAGAHYVPYKSNSTYALGETAGWNVTLPWTAPGASYVTRKNNLADLGRGRIEPGTPAKIEVKLDEPGMVYVEITENTANAKTRALGAVVAPERIGAAIPAQGFRRLLDQQDQGAAQIPPTRSSPPNPVKKTAWTSPSSR